MKKIKFTPEKREPRILTKTILVLPAVLSTGWLAYINYQSKHPIIGADNVQLSPPVDSGMLIAALSMFTVGYIVFLLLMFSEEIGDFIKKYQKHPGK
ncbi:MAG: hypothetical protein ABIC04_05535 [Nanoarchaeota archaeon]